MVTRRDRVRRRFGVFTVLLVKLFLFLPLPDVRGEEQGACAGDIDNDNRVTIDEIVKVVNNALYGCPTTPSPTTSHAPTAPTPSRTATDTAPATTTPTATLTSTPTYGVACPPDMVPVGTEFCIDRYEASRPDATSVSAGTDNSIAASRPGVLPWMVNPMTAAHLETFRAACEAAGKHLCTKEQWVAACTGPPPGTAYVFGNTFNRETCNCVDTFCDDYCADHGIAPAQCNTGANCGYTYNCFHVVPTGTFPQCTNEYGTFDITGNVWEVVPSSSDSRGYEVRGGAFNCASASARLRCAFNAGWNELYAGFRCCLNP